MSRILFRIKHAFSPHVSLVSLNLELRSLILNWGYRHLEEGLHFPAFLGARCAMSLNSVQWQEVQCRYWEISLKDKQHVPFIFSYPPPPLWCLECRVMARALFWTINRWVGCTLMIASRKIQDFSSLTLQSTISAWEKYSECISNLKTLFKK